MLASALRTEAHCFRHLAPTDPEIVESREWSRLSEGLWRSLPTPQTCQRDRAVTRRSGKSLVVQRRQAGRGRLRRTSNK